MVGFVAAPLAQALQRRTLAAANLKELGYG